MRKWFEAAFAPPPKAADAGDQSRFAVLPQNTEDELKLSEVHSKLDRALNFLQRDVGYALLDDVRPDRGGGVRLRQLPPKHAAVAKGERSAREPKVTLQGEEPLLRTSTSPQDSPEDLDGNIMKLLRVTFERGGGRLRANELNQFLVNGQLDRLFKGIRIDQDREITWEEFQHEHAESKAAPATGSTAPASQASTQSPPKDFPSPSEEIVLSQEVSRYAHYQCDLVLVQRFTSVLYKTILQDLYRDAEKGLLSYAEAKKRCVQAIKHDGLYKCVLQGVRLMHLCDYDYADVVLVLGYATVYFRTTFSSIGKKMSPNEAAHVVVLLIYLAHAFLLDETCPLRIWQKHIFRKYCTLKVLDAALFRLFQMRPGFKLRISDEEERDALLGLSGMHSLFAEDGEKASEAIKQMMGSNFTHPKLMNPDDRSKERIGAGRAPGSTNGSPSESIPSQPRVTNSWKSASNGYASGATSSGATAATAAASGSSSGGSNGRSPPSAPGSGQSADRAVEATASRGVRPSAPAPSVQAGRVSEATSLLTAARGHREGNQRRSDRSSKESNYSASRSEEGAMPLVSHADRSLSAAAAVAK